MRIVKIAQQTLSRKDVSDAVMRCSYLAQNFGFGMSNDQQRKMSQWVMQVSKQIEAQMASKDQATLDKALPAVAARILLLCETIESWPESSRIATIKNETGPSTVMGKKGLEGIRPLLDKFRAAGIRAA